jgi:hypothetical protein
MKVFVEVTNVGDSRAGIKLSLSQADGIIGVKALREILANILPTFQI